jgi:hypothetical protein
MDDLSIVDHIDQVAAPAAPPSSTVDHINAALAGVAPDKGRAEAFRQAVDAARNNWKNRSGVETLNEFINLNGVPFSSPVVSTYMRRLANESMQKIESGNYTDVDLGRAAYQHVRDEAEGQQGLGRKLLGAGAHAVGMVGEAYLGGGLGKLVPGGQGAGVVGRAFTGTARNALTTAAMPSLYLEAAQHRAEQQGGSLTDTKNIGPAFVQGMILNKILGSMGKGAEGLVGGIEDAAVRNIARVGVGAVQFPAEQQLADVATSAADNLLPDAYKFNTKYGLMGDLLKGKRGEAGQKFAMQAVMGAVFKAVHAPGAEADRRASFAAELQRYNDKLEVLSRRGMSSQRVFDSATGEIGQERDGEVAQLTKQTPAGPQAAPEATPPEPQPAAGGPQPATIAPPAGTSTPAEAPRAPEAIPESEKPTAQAPAPVGAAPTLTPAQIKELAAGLGMKASEYPGWRAKNRTAAEAMEAAYLGRKPVVAESKPAAFKPVETEGPFVHPEVEAGGPRLLAEMRAAPEYADIAKAVPAGSKPIGRPNSAFVFETPDGKIVRVGRVSESRPDIPHMIQPESVQTFGRFKVEVLPKAERVGDRELFREHGKELREAVEALGWKASDLHPDNIGMVNGKVVFIDPASARPMTTQEREKLAEAQSRRKAAEVAREVPPEEAARSSPPEPATPPAFPEPEVRKDLFGGSKKTFPRGEAKQQQGMFNAATGTTDAWLNALRDKGNVEKIVGHGEGARAMIDGRPYVAKKLPDGTWEAQPEKMTKEERTALMQRGRNRQIRDLAAEKAGVDVKGDSAALDVHPETYHAAADHYLKLAQADVGEHNELIDDAKRALDEFGGAHRMLGAWSAGGKRNAFEDAATIKGIDTAAEQSAKDYPGQYRDLAGDKEHLTDQLFEKLQEGKRQVDVAEAYRRAYAELESVKEYRDALEDAGQDHTHSEIAEALRSADEAEPRHAPEEEGAQAGTGEANESGLTAAASEAEFQFGANAVDLGAAPTTLVGRLEALQDLTPFEKAVLKNMLAEAAGEPFQSPEQVAKAHAKKGGRATALAAQERLLQRAGEPEGTSWQDVRDAEARSRAAIHGGEADGMGQESREGELSDQRYKRLIGQAKRNERIGTDDREKLLDRMAVEIAEKKAAGGDIKSDVELYQKIVEQGLVDEAPAPGISGGQENAPEGKPSKKPRLTALANEVTDRERIKRGLPPLLRAARQGNPESWDRAMEQLERDPDAGKKLVEELARKPRATTVEENALLLHRKVTIGNEADRAIKEYLDARHPKNRAGYSAEQFDAMEKRFDDAVKQMAELDDVTKSTGTEWGRAGQFRRQLAAEDYSLHGMLQKAAAAKGRPLTMEEQQQVADLHAKIKDLERQLTDSEERFRADAGKVVATVERSRQAEIVATSPALKDMLGLRAQSERFKGLFRQNLARDIAARAPIAKRVQDWLVKLRQAFVISSPKTMAKIAIASAQRLLIAPLEEAVGSGLRRIPGIARIAALAPREGRGLSASREAKAFVSSFTEGMRDAWRTVRTGESDLDVTYKGHGDPRSWLDFVGDLHAAAKAPAVRGEFTRSFLSRLDAEASKGVDISNPLVVHKAGIEAFRDSQRAKFQQDNVIVDVYNKAVAKLRAPDAGTGANAVGVGLKIALPVVRVPTNIVAEIGEYAFGTLIGSVKAARAWKLGIETMQPGEAEAVMRQLKKGSLGAAALLAGYLNPEVFGGFRQRDEKRKAGDVGPGEVLTPAGAAPSWTQHNPWLEVFQVGASARRVEDSLKKGQERGPLAGSVAAMLGLAEEVPFVRETTELGKAFDPRSGGYWFGEFMKSLALPQALQWLAGELDTDASGDKIKRKPDTTLEHIETGIPGLRENVPVRKK